MKAWTASRRRAQENRAELDGTIMLNLSVMAGLTG
jgi:hypothetical protein